MDATPSATILDVIESNFETLKAKSYVLRLIYIGEHNFEDPIVLKDYFKKVTQDVNSLYCDVPIKSCLLIYRKYYVCIIEGSEETATRHIYFVFANDVDELLQGRSKLLIVYHNVQKRLSAPWKGLFVDQKDSTTNQNTNNMDLDFQYDFLEKVVHRINKICQYTFENELDDSSKLGTVDGNLNTFPENGDLDILLSFNYIMDLKEYASIYGVLHDYTYSFEKCWPTPFDFTPRGYFDDLKMKEVFVDPLPEQSDFQGGEEVINPNDVVDNDSNVVLQPETVD